MSRMDRPLAAALAGLLILGLCPGLTQDPVQGAEPCIQEDFNDLSHWEALSFKDIHRHSRYTIVRQGDDFVLRASSRNAASAIVHQREFNVYRFPILSWRWKVENLYAHADARTKSGDDYPIRLYVLFPYQEDAVSSWQKLKYNLARAWYGQYPPLACLNYVWTSRKYEVEVLHNAYTERARMLPLRMGRDHLGEWVREQRNIVEDYRRAFGEDPPQTGRLAIMNDSDNTGEQSVSYMDDIRLRPAHKEAD